MPRVRPSFRHPPGRHPAAGDYHEQYDRGPFLQALEGTRRRQATELARTIRELAGPDAAIFDFGAGRGWFLEACRESGFSRVAGGDTSSLSVKLLGEKGIPAVHLSGEAGLPPLPFTPDTLTLLDVIEHFSVESLRETLHGVAESAGPALRLVVIKVPSARGILFRAATLFARAGIAGPLERLYQVGTSPPHHHYFSERSLRRLVGRLGWTVVRVTGDLDFEPRTFPDRVRALSAFPRGIGVAAGAPLGAAARGLHMPESLIAYARPAVTRP